MTLNDAVTHKMCLQKILLGNNNGKYI